jgi:hypothetical protein
MKSPGQGVSEEKVMRSSLWACWTPAVLRFSSIMLAKSAAGAACGARVALAASSVDQLVVLVDVEHRCGERLSTVNGPATRTLEVILVGLVVEVLEVGLGGDGGVDLLLPGDALFHHCSAWA